MSTIQQLKNFIRHGALHSSTQVHRHRPPFDSSAPTLFVASTDYYPGKQARNYEDSSRKHEQSRSPPQQPQPIPDKAMPPSEPAIGHPPQGVHHDAYSEAPGDARNRVAQADHAAAHNVEASQNVSQKDASRSKRVDEANLAKLIAEENASKSKFPKYPGLERWELLEKMGDGAFSNVYRARDLTGEHKEVGIKVVRKYEMNSMQVSASGLVVPALPLALFS